MWAPKTAAIPVLGAHAGTDLAEVAAWASKTLIVNALGARHQRRGFPFSLAESNRALNEIERVLKATPEVEGYSRRTGVALGLGRGSEANTPLGRAVVGGLLAGLVTTLFVVPALYSLVIPWRRPAPKPPYPRGGGSPRTVRRAPWLRWPRPPAPSRCRCR